MYLAVSSLLVEFLCSKSLDETRCPCGWQNISVSYDLSPDQIQEVIHKSWLKIIRPNVVHAMGIVVQIMGYGTVGNPLELYMQLQKRGFEPLTLSLGVHLVFYTDLSKNLKKTSR